MPSGPTRALRSVWRQPRPPGAQPVGPFDIALVAGIAVLAVVEVLVRDDLSWRWLGLAVLLLWAPTLMWRRTRPLLMPLVFTPLVIAQAAISTGESDDLHTAAFGLLMPFSLARWGTGREAVVGLATFVGGAAASMLVAPPPLGDIGGAAAVIGLAVAFGATLRYRSLLRERQVAGVRQDERERLARDLHDTVAHHLSAIAVTAQAGQAAADTRPAAAVEALQRIEGEASQTLVEARQVLRLLRYDGEAARSPGHTIDDLAGLATTSGPAPRVEVSVAADVDPHETTSAAIHRIAQEAVTNARRHARGAEAVTVDVTRTGDGIRLTVRDDGRGATRAPHGFGLLGMTERATLLGGTLEAGPAIDGGWVVSALIPAEPT